MCNQLLKKQKCSLLNRWQRKDTVPVTEGVSASVIVDAYLG